MNARLGVYVLMLTALASCSDDRMVVEGSQPSPIRLSVISDKVVSRAYLYDDDLKNEQEFGLDAYLIDGKNTSYLDNAWVYYFNGWYFRDKTYQGKLLDYYWPNDHRVNFVAYMPYDLNKSVIADFDFTNESGVSFDCTLSGTSGSDRIIDDTKDNQRTVKHEFVYAYRHDCQKGEADKDPVKLRFVHPFAAVKFRLSQSHRNLTIHYITLSGVYNSGIYTNGEDTYDNYKTGQSTLTYKYWNTDNVEPGTLKVDYDKTVPTEINYYSLIGGPYLVIPQSLEDVKLSVCYSWNKGNVNENINHETTTPISISTSDVPAWHPGMIYTYTLNLGDNKEEILFKAMVEPWAKGEDEGYENQYEVK